MKNKKTEVSDFRQKAEKMLKKKLKTDKLHYADADLHKLIQELEVHEIELELQNEELITAVSNASVLAEEYKELYDFAPVGYVSLSDKYIIQELNHVCSGLLGSNRSYFLKTNFISYVSKDTQKIFRDFSNKVFGSLIKQTCEVKLKRKDNTEVYVQIEGILSEDDRKCLTSLRDITDSKKSKELTDANAELVLQKNEIERLTARLLLATRAGGVGVWDYDIVNNVLLWDDQMYAIYGIKKNKFSGVYEAWRSGLHPEDMERGDAEIQMAIRGEKEFDTEFRVIWPDETVHFIRALATVLRDPGGKPLQMIGTNWDITEIRKAEKEKLDVSEKKYRFIIDGNPFGILGVDEKTKMVIFANPAQCSMLGYTEEELKKMNISDIHPADTFKHTLKEFERQARGEIIVAENIQCKRKNGEVFYANISSYRITLDGRHHLVGFFRDMTEHNLAEKAKLEIEQNIKNIANSGQALIWTASLDKKCNYFNKVWLNFTGRTLEQEYGDGWAEGVHPDDLERCFNIYVKAFDKRRKFSMDYRLRRFDGEYRWIQDDGTPLFNNEGIFTGYIGHCLDITERKSNEEALKASEEKYRQLFQSMAQGAVYQNSDGNITDANPAAERLLGLTFKQMNGKKSVSPEWKVIHENGTPFPGETHPSMIALKTGKVQNSIMGVYNPLIDKTLWINVTAIPQFKTGEKKPYQVFVTFNDISVHIELRHAQEALNMEISKHSTDLEKIVASRTSEIEELLGLNTAIVDSVGLIVISTDEYGIINSFNPEAEKMLGYKAEEVIGKLTFEIFHDKNELKARAGKLNEKLKKKIKHSLSALTSKSIPDNSLTDEWTLIRKDGSTFPSILTNSLIEDSEGKTIGYVGVAVDITKRKELEKSLKQSEERFQTMFRNHGAIMLLLNPETGIIVEANKSAEKYYGYDFLLPDKYKLSDLHVLPENELKNEMRKAVERNQNFFVFPHRLSTGEIRTVEIHSSPVVINGQNLLFSVIHDITDRRKAEEKLEKSEALYKSILEESPDNITISDMEGIITMVSASALKMFGHENLDSMVGTHVLDFLAPEEREKANKVIDSKHKGLITGPSEYKALRNDRSIFDIEANVEFIRDAKGEPTNMIFIIRDITDRKKIESELLWNETLMRLMANSSPLGFLVVDNRTDEILYFNNRFCELWGITHLEERMRLGELKNNDIIPDCLHVLEDIPAFAESCKPLQDEENRVVLEDEISFTLGRSIKRFTTQIRGEHDEYYGRFYIFEDITDRKRIEVRLKMQSAAFESFALAVVITDKNAIIEWVNPAFTKLTGFTREEAVGQNTNIIKSDKQGTEVFDELWRTILSGKVWRGEIINKRKDGSHFYEEETITPVLDHNGNIVNFIAIKIDITHRKEMENALRQSEERWQFALEGSGDGVWDWDARTNTVFYSPQLKKMLGYDNKWNNNTDDWINRIHPDDKEKCLEDLEKHYRGETEIYLNEHRLRSRNGNYKWILDRGKVVEWLEKGKPLRVIGTHTDITEIKKLEESLRNNIEKEKELNDMKSRFVSTTSHEFRTPLSSILLGSDALLSYWKKLDEEQIQTRLQRIKEQALHMTDLVNEVMDLSRIQQGKIEFYPEDIDIVALFKKAIDGFNTHLTDKITFECPFSSLVIKLDKRLINQVINNVVNNAIKYSPEKTAIIVKLKQTESEMLLSVSDKGIGIPQADQKLMFTAFYRGSNAKLIQGNGLGLNIIKESLKLLGGDITFKSTEGKGTTFTVRIPKINIIND